jgi:hypothetical protein
MESPLCRAKSCGASPCQRCQTETTPEAKPSSTEGQFCKLYVGQHTFVAWFQLGELRRRSIGLTSVRARCEGLACLPDEGFEILSGMTFGTLVLVQNAAIMYRFTRHVADVAGPDGERNVMLTSNGIAKDCRGRIAIVMNWISNKTRRWPRSSEKTALQQVVFMKMIVVWCKSSPPLFVYVVGPGNGRSGQNRFQTLP